jgi:hypothetical protein
LILLHNPANGAPDGKIFVCPSRVKVCARHYVMTRGPARLERQYRAAREIAGTPSLYY